MTMSFDRDYGIPGATNCNNLLQNEDEILCLYWDTKLIDAQYTPRSHYYTVVPATLGAALQLVLA
jgi:hypothetical protein